jgi:hypothetical protein
MVDLHMRDEARHIAHARTAVESLAREASRWRKRLTSAALGIVIDQFARFMFFPPPPVYRLALGASETNSASGIQWAALAAASTARSELVSQSLQPTLAFLDRLGLQVRSRFA